MGVLCAAMRATVAAEPADTGAGVSPRARLDDRSVVDADSCFTRSCWAAFTRAVDDKVGFNTPLEVPAGAFDGSAALRGPADDTRCLGNVARMPPNKLWLRFVMRAVCGPSSSVALPAAVDVDVDVDAVVGEATAATVAADVPAEAAVLDSVLALVWVLPAPKTSASGSADTIDGAGDSVDTSCARGSVRSSAATARCGVW